MRIEQFKSELARLAVTITRGRSTATAIYVDPNDYWSFTSGAFQDKSTAPDRYDRGWRLVLHSADGDIGVVYVPRWMRFRLWLFKRGVARAAKEKAAINRKLESSAAKRAARELYLSAWRPQLPEARAVKR